MKDTSITFGYYEFDKDCTMYDVNSYSISEVIEVENNKYVIDDEEEESGDTTSGDTVVDNG